MKLPTNISMAIVKEKINNNRLVKGFKRFCNSNIVVSVVAKTIACLVIWAVALIPFWLYLISRWIANPEGFWQELAIIVISMVVIGWLQVILAIGASFLSLAIAFDDNI